MYGLRGNIRNKTLPATAFAVVGIFKIAYYFPFLDFLIQLFGLFYVQNYLWELVSFFGDIHVCKGRKNLGKKFFESQEFLSALTCYITDPHYPAVAGGPGGLLC